MTTIQQAQWVAKAECFARVRAQIRQVLATSEKPLDVAEIAMAFKLRFHYLPSVERRLRELVQSGAVERVQGAIPRYTLL